MHDHTMSFECTIPSLYIPRLKSSDMLRRTLFSTLSRPIIVSQSILRPGITPRWSRLASTASTDIKDSLQQEKAQDWFNRGVNDWNNGNYLDALDAYQKSIYAAPTSAAYYNLANCQYSLGKFEAAIQSWEKSIELESNSPKPDALSNIANTLALHNKDFVRAIEYYRKAVDIDPKDGQIRFNLAVVLEFTGDLKSAKNEYEQAIALGIERAQQNLTNLIVKMSTSKSA